MPSISGANCIVLKAGYTDGGAEHEEGIASGAILPGTHVKITTAADVSQVSTYAVGASAAAAAGTAGAASPSKIATEQLNVLEGKTINDAYASGSRFSYHIPKSGDILQVLALTGEDLDKGEGVAFNAAGKAIAAAVGAVAECLEDSGGVLAADTHIRVRFF